MHETYFRVIAFVIGLSLLSSYFQLSSVVIHDSARIVTDIL
jgi:hypothetical protein